MTRNRTKRVIKKPAPPSPAVTVEETISLKVAQFNDFLKLVDEKDKIIMDLLSEAAAYSKNVEYKIKHKKTVDEDIKKFLDGLNEMIKVENEKKKAELEKQRLLEKKKNKKKRVIEEKENDQTVEDPTVIVEDSDEDSAESDESSSEEYEPVCNH